MLLNSIIVFIITILRPYLIIKQNGITIGAIWGRVLEGAKHPQIFDSNIEFLLTIILCR